MKRKNSLLIRALFAVGITFFLSSAVTRARAQEGEISIPFETVAHERGGGLSQARNLVVTNTTDWQKLWKKFNYYLEPVPQIDFSRKTLLVVFNGMQLDPNNKIEITRIVKVGNNYGVFARENHTHPTCPPPPPTTSSSYHIVVVDKIKKADKRVEFMPHDHQSIPCM